MTQDRMVTPEAVALELPTANAGTRLVAALLDWLIVTVGLALLFFLLLAGIAASDVAESDVPPWLIITTVLLLLTFGLFGYFIIQETFWRGRTVGKAALGLRVVTSEGGQIRFRHAFIRGIFLLIDGILTSGSAGLITILASRRNQRLGDMVAGTIILRERTAMRSPTAVTFYPPPGLEGYTAMLDTTRLGTPEYQALRSFLLRAQSLHPAARYDLAVQLANPVRDLVRPLPPDGVQPEVFLTAVAAAHQRRQRATVPAPPTAPTPPPQPAGPPPGAYAPPPPAASPDPWEPTSTPPPQPEQAPPSTGQSGFAPPG